MLNCIPADRRQIWPTCRTVKPSLGKGLPSQPPLSGLLDSQGTSPGLEISHFPLPWFPEIVLEYPGQPIKGNAGSVLCTDPKLPCPAAADETGGVKAGYMPSLSPSVQMTGE